MELIRDWQSNKTSLLPNIIINYHLPSFKKLLNTVYFYYVYAKKESPLDIKEIKSVSPKGSQPWIIIGRTDAETEVPILWPPDDKNWLIGKTLITGKERRRGWQDKMLWWHRWLNAHEFEQAPGAGKGQGSLACCSPWGCKESETTEWMSNNSSLYV